MDEFNIGMYRPIVEMYMIPKYRLQNFVESRNSCQQHISGTVKYFTLFLSKVGVLTS